MNQYNIIKAIQNSQMKINWKKNQRKALTRFLAFTLGASFTSIVGFHVFHPSILLVGFTISECMAALDIHRQLNKKRKANQVLENVLTELKKHGIQTSKFKLKKAKLGVYCDAVDHSEFQENQVALFKNHRHQLIALCQVKRQLLQKNDELLDPNYTEIVTEKERVKELCYKINR